MQKIFQKIQKLLRDNPDCCFCKWTGVPDPKHMLIRLDRVYLNFLFTDKKGTNRFRRILGYRKDAGTNEEAVVFTPKLVRIQNGVRRGRLVLQEQLWETERWKNAGVSKVLSIGQYPWTFSKRRTGDRQIIELLEELLSKDRPLLSRIAYPLFYLVASVRNREVQLRDSSAALRFIQKAPGYNPLLAPSENMTELGDVLARRLPNNKLAWPFCYFCRAGVLTADPATMYDWFIVPKEAMYQDIEIEELGNYV